MAMGRIWLTVRRLNKFSPADNADLLGVLSNIQRVSQQFLSTVFKLSLKVIMKFLKVF